MEDISRYGRVRKATIGEVPTHLADESIMSGDGLIVREAKRMMRDNLERQSTHIFIGVDMGHPGGDKSVFIPEPWMLREWAIKRRAQTREKWNIIFTFFFVLLAIGAMLLLCVALTPPQAQAQTITIVDAPPKPPTVHAVVTAYTSSVDETDKTPLITASGAHTAPGVIACPAQYPFGTQVKIGDATYTCLDRMSPKFPDRFDVWVHTKAEAYAWGYQQTEVAIISTP